VPAGRTKQPRFQASSTNSNRKRHARFSGCRGASFTFRAIGHVESVHADTASRNVVSDESSLVLHSDLKRGLDGVSPGDRLMVVFVFDRAGECELRQHPKGDRNRALRGVFALRSPRRPNPIGVTVVEVLDIAGNVVRVRGIDAWPGTPILDLKPVIKEER